VLTAEVQAEILNLYFTEKCSVRSISLRVGVHRRSVQRVIARRGVALGAKKSTRASILDPFGEVIREKLRKNPYLPSTALLNQLRDLGFTGGLSRLKEYVRSERMKVVRPREAFLRLDFAAGDVVQVDWGEFGDVFGDGVKVHCFAMVMAFSRMIYVEFTRSEKFEEFIRCHESGFRFFGGVPRECWYDNLTSAVSDRVGQLIRFNSRFLAYMAHHGSRPHACNVARGNEKGRVEDLIKYIRMNFWPGRSFENFEDLIKQSIIWRNQVANQREHRTTRRVIRLIFESAERPKLLPLNPVPYDTDEVFSRHVGPDFHLQYESNRYSVPWTLVGLTVTVRVNNLEFKVFYNEKFICAHPRSYLKNQVIAIEGHKTGLLERKPGATRESWQLGYIKGLGPKMAEYVELVRRGPRSLKYELTRLVALVTVYGEEMVRDASADCLSAGIVGVDSVELYLKRRHHPSQTSLNPEPIKFLSEKLNRVHPAVDLRRYDALLFEGQNECSASERVTNGDGQSAGASDRGPGGAETQVLGARAVGRPSEHEGSGAGGGSEAPESLDRQGKVGAAHADDPDKNQVGEVPQASDGGEL